MSFCRRALFLFALLFLGAGGEALAASRDASFLAPSAPVSQGSSGCADGAVGVEPKNEIDLGETGVNVGKRTTIFFVNTTNLPVDIASISANGDTSVNAEIVADDCSKQGTIAASSRCAVTVEVTPTAGGAWTAEVLMTHNGEGRLARAKLTGKTSASSIEKKTEGLSLSTKDIKPINFGDTEIGAGKAVRSALMVNDSGETITILSIEVIAAENGLERLNQGCAEDMDLKPGESCPVTLVWDPKAPGAVSTDLIIRHSGRLGFAVIPVRGTAKLAKAEEGTGGRKGGKAIPEPSLSPSADDVEKIIAGKMAEMKADSLPPLPDPGAAAPASVDTSGIHLIGTVGPRALLYVDGATKIVAVGEDVTFGDDHTAKLTSVTPKQAEILVGGEKKVLFLETVSALTSKAAQKKKERSLDEPVKPSAAKKKKSASESER